MDDNIQSVNKNGDKMQKDSIKYNGHTIEYEWTTARRKTIGLTIAPDGMLTVKAPLGTTREYIRQCVTKKAEWILSKTKKLEERQDKTPDRHFQDGEILFYLGQEYAFRQIREASIKEENVAVIRLDKEKNEIQMYYKGLEWSAEEKKDILEQWYRREARQYLWSLAEKFSQEIPCTFGTIRIKNQKTCWGSCSAKGNLNFNWRIMMAPPEIGEYLVVHELCHRLEMNHSTAFWKLVEKQIPDYRERRAWLKNYGYLLEW